jgi:hypothetical protein
MKFHRRPVERNASTVAVLYAALGLIALSYQSVAAAQDPASHTSAGGLLELPAEDSLGQNQVGNSGFEAGDGGWRLGPCWSVDRNTAHQGSRSLRFDANASCIQLPAETLIPASRKTARSYTLRAWVKTSEGSDLKVRVALHDQNDNSYILGGTDLVSPGFTWQLLERKNIDLLPAHDRHVLQVWAVVRGSTGSAWFDDVELVEQTPLSLSAFLLYPNFRGYLWSSGPPGIRVQVNAAVPDFSKVRVRAVVTNESGARVKSVEQATKESQVLEINGSSLGLGSYSLRTELLDAQTGRAVANYPPYRIVKVSDDFRSSLMNYVAPDNFLVHKGEKRFVWGVYDRFSAHFRCRDCLFTNTTGYEKIPGFSGLHTIENYSDTLSNVEMNILPFAGVRVTPPRDELTPWLQALDRHGVGHLQIMNNFVEGSRGRPLWARDLSDPQLWHLVTEAMRGKPGGIGYYTYDEPMPDKAPAVFAQSLILRESDAGSITFGVLANFKQVFRWRDVSDVIGCDPYPIGNMLNADDVAYGAASAPVMLRTSVWTRETVRQVYSSRPVWIVPQLFRLNGQFPTYEHMKMQAYKAIINGATGILWWGFVSEKGIEAEWHRMNNHQAYFDFKRISHEVMALEPVLISPSRSDLVSVSAPNIEFLVKSDPGRIVVLASNFSDAPASNVTISLAHSDLVSNGRVEVYAEARTLPIVQAGAHTESSFTDSFGSYDVHVYIINRHK